MLSTLKKFENKIINQRLANSGEILIGSLDDEVFWNSDAPETEVLEPLFSGLNINSLLFARPAEPYRTILSRLVSNAADILRPEDSESRTFLHEIPVVEKFDAELIQEKLKGRKAVIIKDHGIVSHGSVSPEQAFVAFSSVLFATYIKFFSDTLKSGSGADKSLCLKIMSEYEERLSKSKEPSLITGPFSEKEAVLKAMAEAGRLTVESGMVDSFFGNISYRGESSIYISRSGSSLDELEGDIDECFMDKSSTSAITASSEYTAHKSVYEKHEINCVLHGHPKYSVIRSLICAEKNCEFTGRCHTSCPVKRYAGDIPIVPGEVGTGRFGLCNTLPDAFSGRGVIVYGHGLFTGGITDFNSAFKSLVDIELMCLDECRAIPQNACDFNSDGN